jgi:hypothetical protein
MGIASSNFTGTSGNSLGTVIDAGDAYLYTLGNTGNAIGGNLVVGAGTTGKLIKLIAGSGADTNVTMTIDAATTPATTTTTGAVTISGGMGVTGNIIPGNVITGGILSATGNVRGGNVNTAGTVSAAGNVVAGNVSTTGNVNAAAGSIGNLTVSGTITAGNINANVSGSITNAINVTGNSQPNITSVGTLTTLDVAGNATITGNLQVTGNVTYINSNVVAIGDLLINVANNASNASQAFGGGIAVGPVGAEYATLTFNSTTTSWNTNIPLSVNGTVSAGQFSGNGNGISNIQGANISGPLSSLSVIGNIDSSGNINVSGSVTSASLATGTIINTAGNGVGNIGNSTNYFNTIFAKATSAQYADLAEVYVGDTTYAPGTVLSFGGNAEVTQSIVDLDVTVAGVVSTNPAYIMNTSEVDPNMVVVALTGRVPCFVVGPVTKGAMMVSAGNGAARAEKSPVIGSVIGKALQSFDGEFGTIEIVVGRL